MTDLAGGHRVMEDDPPLLLIPRRDLAVGPGALELRVVQRIEGRPGIVGPVRVEVMDPDEEGLAPARSLEPGQRLVGDFPGRVSGPAAPRVRLDLEALREARPRTEDEGAR